MTFFCVTLYVDPFCGKPKAVASWGVAIVPRPPYLKSVPPVLCLAPRLLHTSNIVFEKCGPSLWLSSPLLRNPGDGPGKASTRLPAIPPFLSSRKGDGCSFRTFIWQLSHTQACSHSHALVLRLAACGVNLFKRCSPVRSCGDSPSKACWGARNVCHRFVHDVRQKVRGSVDQGQLCVLLWSMFWCVKS